MAFCNICKTHFHRLGYARHMAMHRDKYLAQHNDLTEALKVSIEAEAITRRIIKARDTDEKTIKQLRELFVKASIRDHERGRYANA